MKTTIVRLMAVSCVVFGVSCSTTGVQGSLPIPFTNPPTNVTGEIEITPLPPKVCVGLDIVPRPAPEE